MGINFNKIGGVNKVYNNNKVEAKKNVSSTAKVEGKRDELQISKEAMDFQTVMKSVKLAKELPDVREDVIAPIKEKIDKDIYEVDGKSIAEKMLTSKFNIKI
ncbi:MAG: flagellar biosynthesis anti-sigma factor FlgM [Bacillota bacterium]